jgi:phage portal protein BeeE
MGVIKKLSEVLFGKTTTAQRAIAAGHVVGHPVTPKYEELNHGTDFNFIAIHAVAKQFAQSTITVKQKQQTITKGIESQDSPEEQSTALPDHPIAKLLAHPNPMKSGQEFLYQVAWQFRTTGGVVIWEVPNAEGKPVELYVLPWSSLVYQIPSREHPLGEWRVHNPRGFGSYFGRHAIGNNFLLDVRETIIASWAHPIYPGEPLSPLSQCAQIIDIAEKMEEATVAALQNSIRSSIVLSFEGDPTETQMKQIEKKLADSKAGVHNTGSSLLLGAQVKVDSLGSRMPELDAVNVRKQNMDMVLAVQATPSIATGGDNSGTYSGNAAVINTHVELSVQPELDLLAGKLTHRWERLYDGIEIEINAKRMDDPTLQFQRADKLLQGLDKGASNIDEWRASMNLPPLPNGAGKAYEKAQPPTPPGMPGAGPPQDDASALAVPDLDDGMGDDETTGAVDPMRQAMPAQVKRLAWLNGYRDGDH